MEETVEAEMAAAVAEGDVVAETDAFAVANVFDLTPVRERFMREYQVSEIAALRLEQECKRYLVLCALSPGESLSMSGPVDQFWHTFILFTRLYAEFCEAVAGRFLHHTPDIPDEPTNGLGIKETYERYRQTFKEDPPSDLWPS